MKYVCTVCGYVYDDAEQDVPFEELPDSWNCPLCGAPKALFKKVEEDSSPEKATVNETIAEASNDYVEDLDAHNDDLVLLSAGEISALFSNLARGCEKQYQNEAMECFSELASYFENLTEQESNNDLERLADLIKQDLDINYKELSKVSKENGDRGTLRVVTWGEKVSLMAKNLIDRYNREGDAFLQNTGLYICTVCGFLYVGDTPPQLCPVCKVPSWKFEKIDGRSKI